MYSIEISYFSLDFNTFQQVVETGSGAEGRGFESLRPDHNQLFGSEPLKPYPFLNQQLGYILYRSLLSIKTILWNQVYAEAVSPVSFKLLWGTRVSACMLRDLNQKIYGKIDEWRERLLVGNFPCVFLDGLWLKRSWGGEVKNVSVLVAIGVAQSRYREILAVSEGAKEDKASWTQFLRDLMDAARRESSCSAPTSAWGW